MPVETMARTEMPSWHRVGTPLDHPATAAEAIQAAGLDWSVALEPVQDLRGRPIPGSRALVRTDRMEPLSVVGTGYRPIQNVDAFRFADLLVGEDKAIYESAGSLDGGRRIWLEAKLPGDVWVEGEDRVQRYLLLTNPHFRGSSLWVLLTARRLVCENMLFAALAQGRTYAVRIRHTGDLESHVAEARRLLGISLKYFDDFGEQARRFAKRSMSSLAVKEYFEGLVPDPKDADPVRAASTRETLLRLFESGRGSDLPGARGTLWGAVNAVSEFTDHKRSTRGSSARDSGVGKRLSRWKSAMFGSGRDLKERAWQRALALVN
jgi:phage/plasmid-like protein (TIGR03299 family)